MCGLLGLLAGCGHDGSSAPDSAAGPSCAANNKCGGEIAGTWDIESECLEIASPFDAPGCEHSVVQAAVDVKGSVTYAMLAGDRTRGTQDYSLSYHFELSEQYSEACLLALGFEGATEQACHGLEVLWAGPIAVTCAVADAACRCDFADAASADGMEGFQLGKGQIQAEASGNVDYCRSGKTLSESSQTGSSRQILTLRRRP